MKPIDQLRNIFCNDAEIKKDLKEVKFWTKIRYWSYIVNFLYSFEWEDVICWKYWLDDWIIAMNRKIDEVIWNDIHERHLRMYCENKNIIMSINNYNSNQSGIFFDWNGCCILDNTKDLQNQSDETIQKIIDYLNSVK